jgi:hypothetical protein
MLSPVTVQNQNGHFSVMGIRKIINSLPDLTPSEIASQFPPPPRTFEQQAAADLILSYTFLGNKGMCRMSSICSPMFPC